MAGHQQHGIFELVLGALAARVAEIAGHDRGADRDRRDQQRPPTTSQRIGPPRAAVFTSKRGVRGFIWYRFVGEVFDRRRSTPDRTRSYPRGMELTLAVWVNGRLSAGEVSHRTAGRQRRRLPKRNQEAGADFPLRRHAPRLNHLTRSEPLSERAARVVLARFVSAWGLRQNRPLAGAEAAITAVARVGVRIARSLVHAIRIWIARRE